MHLSVHLHTHTHKKRNGVLSSGPHVRTWAFTDVGLGSVPGEVRGNMMTKLPTLAKHHSNNLHELFYNRRS